MHLKTNHIDMTKSDETVFLKEAVDIIDIVITEHYSEDNREKLAEIISKKLKTLVASEIKSRKLNTIKN